MQPADLPYTMTPAWFFHSTMKPGRFFHSKAKLLLLFLTLLTYFTIYQLFQQQSLLEEARSKPLNNVAN